MKLRKLELHGFKSFADRTDFVFEDGITGIVGPNGCGKSNVVDAVRWVLGEQSAKSLRGNQMMDVIFGGSASRKAQGLAEITLTFDNTQSLMPVDSDTVSVTRKLYRSGESEYLINKNPCRLKDVRDLFMDTGLGRDSYSIIEQGKVDQLVQSNSVDRRAIFDEAAGIAKYKSRRKEASRKLERTDQDLLRVNDIVEEVQRQLRSVKLQAGKARSFQEYDHRLRQLRISGSLAEYDQLIRQRKGVKDEQSRLEDQSTTTSNELSRVSAEKVRLSLELAEFDRQITAADNQLLQNQAHIASAKDHIEFAHKRTAESREDLNHQRQRSAQVKVLAGELQARIARQQQLAVQYGNQEEQLQSELYQIQAQHTAAGQKTVALAADLEDEKSGIVDLVRRTSQLHNEISGQDRFRRTLSAQRDRISTEASALESKLETVLIRKAQLEEKTRQIDGVMSQDQQAWENSKIQTEHAEIELSQLNERLAQTKEDRSALQSRESLLQEMDARWDGVHQGVREILADKAVGRFEFILGMVGNLFEADVAQAGLVEAALAGAEQFLVVTDSNKLSAEMDQFGKLPGRVTFLCLDLIPPWVNGYDWSAHPEFLGRAVDYVHFDPMLGPVAWHLLGRTIVIKDLNAVLKIASQAPAGYRYVTPQGQLLEPDGLLRLGPLTGTSGVMLRHSELRQLSQKLPKIEAQITEFGDQLQSLQGKLSYLKQTQQKLRTAIYEANVAKAQNHSEVQQTAEAIANFSKDKPRLAEEVGQLEVEISHALKAQDDSRQELSQLEELSQQRNARIEQLTEQHRQAFQTQQTLAEKVSDLRVALAKAHEQCTAAQSDLAHLQQSLEQNHRDSQAAQQDIEAANGRITEAEQSILKAEARLAQLYADREILQKDCTHSHQQRDTIAQQIEAQGQQERQLSEQRAQLAEGIHQYQLKLSEINVRIEALTRRVQEEFALSLEQEYQNYQPTELDLQQVAAEIEELRGKIQRLGNVNLDAISQQDELEARLAFLQGQQNDIIKSKTQLEELIRHINHESREIFMASFTAIRERFGEFFRKLFGGGRADIVLTNPEDPLECDIEIIARPPGKELQSISLLSGGEKTMAAVALLFAIFRSKPSPLCILDEVDAALDEANNERFNALVREFLTDSQFIIITHSKRTMSTADVLYGITMQEPGVSKRVSVKFDNQAVQAVA